MAKVSPFKGWRYNEDIITLLGDVIVPPYDVITKEEQDGYYDKSPYNYIRINLNNTPSEEKYLSAANTLNMWIGSGVLVEEQKPAIYILSQSFILNGARVERISCICALTLSELGDDVLPHEQTIDKHLDDRYKLMSSTSANSGQIFMCYKDEEMSLETLHENLKSKPSIDVELDDVQYKIWPVTDINAINQFVISLESKKLVIADGHHRYKTALKYSKNHPSPQSEKVMVTLANSKNPGMQILPTHRIIKKLDVSIPDIKKSLNEYFTFEEFEGVEQLLTRMEKSKNKKGVLGLFHKSSNTGLLLEFCAWEVLENDVDHKMDVLKKLDTNILHRFLLNGVFGIDTNKQADLENLSYLRGNNSPKKMLNKVEYEVVCFVNPPSLDDVFTIAENGEVMPQKSTYFFPKVYSGLVTRNF
ncbi:MAG: hypothetical protein ACI87X_001453 [Candidatus Arcticimaribacter sp.]|jgi:uncharacterized protein (DUF1015 family)|tara:strand:+ start:2937 stop:4187 length:1251 start_codon:yes stop_codon:yes gene_type:complete